jgi:hypothetical protein
VAIFSELVETVGEHGSLLRAAGVALADANPSTCPVVPDERDEGFFNWAVARPEAGSR